jgi:predicted glycosyltransferase involved in capsule biosynthesis
MNSAKMPSMSKASIPDGPVSAGDITMVFCVRLHDGNPWIADRLDRMADYYQPCPPIVVVDFGSEPPHRDTIATLCARQGYRYHFVDDPGVFSLSLARNIGASMCTTDFIYFCDPDFISECDLFQRLAETATALDMRHVIDVMLNPPAFHLGAVETQQLEGLDSVEQQSLLLRKLAFTLNYAEVSGPDERYVAPYSNVFLISRKMFSLVGGYDPSFRGHGSEDFEFLLRFCLHASLLPLPGDPEKDLFGPLRSNFYQARSYVGFRRLFELLSQPAEGLGLKVFHRHHPRAKEQAWYASGDRKRENFRSAARKYLSDRSQLLAIDHLDRGKTIACLCKNKDTLGYFLPLRLLGYRLIPVLADKKDVVDGILSGLEQGRIDDIAIFNPYMKSHAAFRPIFDKAKALGRHTIVIERGALPGTIYYDEDVCYNSAGFSEAAFLAEAFSAEELEDARSYVEDLRGGGKTLEQMGAYEDTAEKYRHLLDDRRIKCFVPLQLEDDMAVTLFLRGEQSYPQFLSSLSSLVEDNADVLFIIKPHPLSKTDLPLSSPNVIAAERGDNIHALIDSVDATLCYNSGVGLLSLLHETITITLGNAFYNLAGAGHRAPSAAAGIAALKKGELKRPERDLALRIAAWFTLRKYSRFCATDQIVEFQTRKSHGYKDICVTELRWKDAAERLGRLNETVRFSWLSYAGARMAPPRFMGEPDPASAEALSMSGFAAYREGRHGQAAEQLVQAFALKESQPNLLRHAAEAYLLAGDRKAAIAAQKAALEHLPTNKRVRLRLWIMRVPILGVIFGQQRLKRPQ